MWYTLVASWPLWAWSTPSSQTQRVLQGAPSLLPNIGLFFCKPCLARAVKCLHFATAKLWEKKLVAFWKLGIYRVISLLSPFLSEPCTRSARAQATNFFLESSNRFLSSSDWLYAKSGKKGTNVSRVHENVKSSLMSNSSQSTNSRDIGCILGETTATRNWNS
jgi:hypothetical protein